MTDLPEILLKELDTTFAYSDNSKGAYWNEGYNKGIMRAFVVLQKAGWHDVNSCSWNNKLQSMNVLLAGLVRAGWHSKTDCKGLCPEHDMLRFCPKCMEGKGFWCPERKQQALEELKRLLLSCDFRIGLSDAERIFK